MTIVDVHSHWGAKRGYPLQTEEELAQQRATRSLEPTYRTEAGMGRYFLDSGGIVGIGAISTIQPMRRIGSVGDVASPVGGGLLRHVR